MTGPGEYSSMAKEDRMRQVLNLLTETGMALPPAVVFRNLKLRGATFESRSVNTYLKELTEGGYVRKVAPEALDQGELVDVDDLRDEGYYVATDRADEFPE